MCILQDRKHFQYVIYLLSSRIHCPNSVHIFSLLSSHKVIVAFFQILHYAVVVWCFLGQLNSCIRLKFATVPERILPWWLLISLMNKILLDMQHQFMARNSEVVKSPFNAKCVMRQASCMRFVDNSVTK